MELFENFPIYLTCLWEGERLFQKEKEKGEVTFRLELP